MPQWTVGAELIERHPVLGKSTHRSRISALAIAIEPSYVGLTFVGASLLGQPHLRWTKGSVYRGD